MSQTVYKILSETQVGFFAISGPECNPVILSSISPPDSAEFQRHFNKIQLSVMVTKCIVVTKYIK